MRLRVVISCSLSSKNRTEYSGLLRLPEGHWRLRARLKTEKSPTNRRKAKKSPPDSFPILFLDFDGVLNTPRTWIRQPVHARIESRLVRRVARICTQANARVVISSSWRCSHELAELRRWLAAKGLRRSYVIDSTRDLQIDRQMEILAWLSEHPECSNYVILDDDTAGYGEWDKLSDRWVRVDPETGVTDDDVRAALRILSVGEFGEF